MRPRLKELIRLGLSRSTGKWLILGSCVGLICGLIGFAFHVAVESVAHIALRSWAGYHVVMPPGEVPIYADDGTTQVLRPIILVLVMVGGGLISGLICWKVVGARGGGTGAAVRAFHQHQGRITLGTAFAKFFASAATLGTGGSAGREGPISLIGAGFGSWFADRMGLPVRDRRILLTVGIAGGVAALFRAPLAGALYAAEVLYSDSELEAEALIPAFLAAIIAFCTFGLVEAALVENHLTTIGAAMFMPPTGLSFSAARWQELGGYVILVVAIASSARLFVRIGHGMAHRFQVMRVPEWARPAVGAAATAAIALTVMGLAGYVDLGAMNTSSSFGILGSGYGIVQQALETAVDSGNRWVLVALFGFIAVGKMFATACTVGSGGSGGEFAPSIVIGGCIGAGIGCALSGLPIAPAPAACTIMGMAGFLAATHRTPIAALLMVSEITGNYHLLIPAMWVTALSFLLAGRGSSLVAGQVQGPLASPAHRGHFFNDLLSGILVEEAMINAETCHTLKPGSPLSECRNLLRDSNQTVFPVVGDDGRLVGEVTLDDLRVFLYDQDLDLVAVAQDVMSAQKWSLTPRDSLTVAMRRFNAANLDELPVVEANTDQFLGLLTRRSCIAKYNQLTDQLRSQRQAEGYDGDATVD